MLIFAIANAEDGTEARVTSHICSDYYNVSLWDTDAGEALPTVRGFRYVSEAIAYAEKIVGVKA